MTGIRADGDAWERTAVALRPDIYRLALERGIDISDVCNRALAALTGCEYPRGQREPVPALPPVIIAKDGASLPAGSGGKKTTSRKMHPVINADDPAAPAKVAEAKNASVKSSPSADPAPVSPPVTGDEGGMCTADLQGKPVSSRSHAGKKKKQSVTEALKRYFSEKIIRTGDAMDRIGKEEFYTLFARFCHDRRIAPVPERRTVTVALKNKFAMTEEVSDGIPAWTGIQVK